MGADYKKSIESASTAAVGAINKATAKIKTAEDKNKKDEENNTKTAESWTDKDAAIAGKESAQKTLSENGEKIKELDQKINSRNKNKPDEAKEIEAFRAQKIKILAENEQLKTNIGVYNKTLGLETGGYTGDFEGGKLALLHKKELVLNKEDTKNILDSIKITRDMVSFANPKEAISSIPPSNTSNSTVINASFPNVSSSEEIRKAFSNMSNNASQFAYRMKPAY
jgi:hypothetical protein